VVLTVCKERHENGPTETAETAVAPVNIMLHAIFTVPGAGAAKYKGDICTRPSGMAMRTRW
jgi:hypothetical protein